MAFKDAIRSPILHFLAALGYCVVGCIYGTIVMTAILESNEIRQVGIIIITSINMYLASEVYRID